MEKILHISKYYYPFKGGTEQIAHECVDSLKNEYDQKIICFNHIKGNIIEVIDGVEVIRCGCVAKISSQSISASYSRMLKKCIKNYNPDIIIFHYPNPLVCFLLLKYIHRETKLIVYWHLDIVRQKVLGKFFAGQNRRLIYRANLIIATSPEYVVGSPYLNKVKEKCKIVPNCINTERLTLSEKAKEISIKIREKNKGKIMCLAVGRHTKYKGFKYLIRASKKLDDRFEIYIAGKGEETKKLKKEARSDAKIHFLGSINEDELVAYMSAMDIFCFPSITKNEAFGLALAEGMYFEKPAVTFHIQGSGVNYVCLDGETGLEVKNRSVEAYAAALTKLADDTELRKILGKNGKKRVLENFVSKQFKANIKMAIYAVQDEQGEITKCSANV